MKIAILSDIHGNMTALEAVIADIRLQSPDLVLHGGDLADAGSSPVEVVDRIRDLGWQGVLGNTDEMLFRPAALEDFAAQSSAPPAIWNAIRDIAGATRAVLGEERLTWLSSLPRVETTEGLALTHATLDSCWAAPGGNTSDEELAAIYSPLGQPTVVFAHTHIPSIRRISGTPDLLINTGSVGLSYDGDPRASYVILREGIPEVRRVEYDVDHELQALASCSLPGAIWTAKMLRTGRPAMP